MQKSLFGDLEKQMTEGEAENVGRLLEAYKTNGVEGLIDIIIEIRDDVTKEEIMERLRNANINW